MYTNMPYPNENNIDINNTNLYEFNQNQMMGNMNNNMNEMSEMGIAASPIVEPMQERVINRTIVHEVPHICPIRTKIINNHVYKHTYQKEYSCCSEDKVTNVQCGSCCGR